MRPLQGIRVLDLSRLLPGPFATLVLADLGATVDKIEDPGQGDYLRHMPPQIAGANAAFAMLNRGKRSAVLDLKQQAAREALRKMLATYDVLFEQFRPGVLDRLGLGIDALRAAQPRLVVCSLTGYGQTGPMRDKAGHDLNYLARAGILGATGPESAPPTVPGFQLADISGGLWSVVAILAALRERDRTGQGAHLDIAMSEGTLPFMTTTLAAAVAGSPRARGAEELTGGIAPYAVYETSDARYVSLAALEPKFWTAFAAEMGFEASLGDLMPGPHQAPLKEKVAQIFKQKTFEEWSGWARERDCLVEPVLAPSELTSDAHLAARGIFFELESARGSVPQMRTPVTPRDLDFAPPPESGEHTRAVLQGAGLGPAEIEALLSSGAAR
ncbi:MAG TPA: CaiB/BaiF CoA-transferase family protein [Polyangiaceae bacterium]|jgi:crotonobetainyl-CoA:carnitine CoA-transferase CaiB-like acyl-CoA transferase|nr:CaiB/BaiF CoA-transferase family protein [Polyangiaceae bacterium]